MKFRVLILLSCAWLLTNCSSTPTAQPSPQPTVVPSQIAKVDPTGTATAVPTATANVFGLNIIAQYDATTQILTIYGITPGATVVLGGTPLLPPATATATNTLAPTETPTPTETLTPQVFVPRPTHVPTVPVTAASLHGKIVFKSGRDGGIYPSSFSYYAMNPDGSGVQRLDFNTINPIYTSLQGREGFSPDGSKVVLGERHCFGGGFTCALYILDTQLDAALINSNNDISHGQWVFNKSFQAKDPVWSPGGNYIAFASNNEQPSGKGCVRTTNLFKGTPMQRPVIRRLTEYCSGSDAGHPSFSPDGSKLAFWSEDTGLNQIYTLDVGADDTFDYRFANPHIISDHQSDDWDPLWVK